MIDMLVASDTKNYDSVFSAGDHITVVFNQPTNKGNLAQKVIQKPQVDNLFSFSCSLGSNYTASWIDSRTFQIEVLNTSGNGSPRIGQFFATTLANGNLRNFPPICSQVKGITFDFETWIHIMIP